MISVADATDIVLSNALSLGTEKVPLAESLGRILAEPLNADRDFPPFNRVTMDGISIQFSSFEKGIRTFPIQSTAPAGEAQQTLNNPEHCIESMTGAVLPEGCDTVIRYEDLTIENGTATINLDILKWGQNVHKQGEDRQQGSQIVGPGKMISPAEIGVAATIGKHEVNVMKTPSVLIISTGDELVNVDETPAPHQIRSSNVHTIRAACAPYGLKIDEVHLLDNYETIRDKIANYLNEYQVLILSGGVSKGKFDYVPNALAELKAEKLFHRVAQRPGKPFWFGTAPSGTVVFALPGNPVSSFMCFNRYFIPWLRKSLGLAAQEKPLARLDKPIFFKPDLTYLAQVKLSVDPTGQMCALPVEGNGSGDLANLTDADAFMEIPRGKENFEAGELYPVIRYRPF
ncbi:MAG: molybdopterin molybdotransferase MoeA [Bacteroidota bacterium]